MTKQLERTEAITTAIIEGMESGTTITSICAADDMPSVSTFLRWCRSDDDLDDAVQRAWERGLVIQLHEIQDKQAEAVERLMDEKKETDPKSYQALATLLRDMNHNKVAMLTRLDRRFAKRHEVIHNGPMVIGWDNSPLSCPECGWTAAKDITPQPAAIEHQTTLPVPANDATGGDAR